MSLCTIKYVVNHMNVNKNIKYAQLKRKKFLMPIYPVWIAWQPLLYDSVLAFQYCRPHFSSSFQLSVLMILTIYAIPFGKFCADMVMDENVYNGSLC